jgi:phage baseplate assembly protein gpV
MHLQDPYVPSPADHLGHVTLTVVDIDGTEPSITVRAEIRLMDVEWNQVATRTGDPRHYMPEDWQERATVLIQEFRTATALIHDVSAAPPPDPEE